MKGRLPKNPHAGKIASRIALLFVLAGAAWILASTVVTSLITDYPAMVTLVEVFKDLAFTGLTAIVLYLLVNRDISALEMSEKALQESEEKFRTLVDTTTSAIFMYRDAIIHSNPAMHLLTGYDAEALPTISLYDLIHPDFREQFVLECRPFSPNTHPPARCELKIVTRSGDERWIDFSTRTITYEGELTGLGTATDITARKLAEETLRESEERYRVTTETAPDAILVIDDESTVIFTNPAVTKIFGYTPEEILGRSVTALMPERFRALHLSGIKRYIATGKASLKWEALRFPGLHKNGHEIPLEISYCMFTKGGRYFFSGIARDVTEREQVEKEKEYKKMLEWFTREQETVVAERTMNLMALKLAHTVRNPVTVIGWKSRKLLGRDDLAPELKDHLADITHEAEHLETTVREFEDLLKSRQSVFRHEDVNEIVKGIVPIMGSEASLKEIELVSRLSEQPLRINAQKELLRLVVFNLMQNAVEATPEGGEVCVTTSGDGNTVMISVADTGPGIASDLLDRIFDPFYSTKTHRFGMGLSLIKQIVAEHMGKIEVHSQPGRGTTFAITFPARWMKEA